MHGNTELTELLDSEPYYQTNDGAAYLGDSLELLDELPEESIDLLVTSPPFGLQKKKEYGNKDPDEYNDWFMDFADRVYRVLTEDGSWVIDIGGGWEKGKPVRSIYHFELLTRLAGSDGPFHLAQDFYWYNPAKLPTPAQWVTIERIRCKDAVNHVWCLSKTERPEADNVRVLQEYSDSQKELMENGYKDKKRPSGHDISDKFDDPKEKGSIPPNLLEIANTASNTHYLKACKKLDVDSHPARFPRQLPDFFIRFLSEPGDTVLDIFAGSNMTGRVAQDLGRKWLAFELQEKYLQTSKVRFMTMEEIDKIIDEDQSALDDFEEFAELD
ncbi:DNA methylase N-4/N-6 domain protein [Halopiger xanaduensis SH-6]|uniref:Type II methyltransferase n=2 Tax=Halopiger xanaduensis TaxID=387343 RepID=F8D4R3_HALXS|nr:DNA methylase N-4/N-6 domain protein [Halopiger xanaduensis SH-6]